MREHSYKIGDEVVITYQIVDSWPRGGCRVFSPEFTGIMRISGFSVFEDHIYSETPDGRLFMPRFDQIRPFEAENLAEHEWAPEETLFL